MHPLTRKALGGLAALALLVGTPALSSAAPVTVVSFLDPEVGDTDPDFLFTFVSSGAPNFAGSTLTGSYTSGPSTGNLMLSLFDGFTTTLFQNASMDTFTIVASDGSCTAGQCEIYFSPGTTITFRDESSAPIFYMSFDSARLDSPANNGVGASDLALQNVNLFLPTGDPFADPESFSFSFAAQTGGEIADADFQGATVRWTSSMTGSAEVGTTQVPEPGTMLLLGIGLLTSAGLFRRR